MKTEIYDVSKFSEELLREAEVLGDADARREADALLRTIDRAADVIRAGGLVAFPTETVYGLGANAFDEEAVRRVYAAKGRPSDNPMIVHVARAGDIGLLTPTLTAATVRLIDAFWPGPLTMVFPKNPDVPKTVTGGLDTVAVRMPDDPVAAELIRRANTPVAAPSANRSGRPSPTRGEHVVKDLDGAAEVILTGRPCRVGIESTVLDLTGETPVILRPGVVTARQISAVMDAPVETDPALLVPRPAIREDETPAPKAPGMKYRHYAPDAEMLVLEGRRDRVKREAERLKTLNERIGRKVGVILFEETAFFEAAHEFFARLRAFDEDGADLIIAGALGDGDGVGFAVMNRMMKAAGYNVARV